MAEQTKNTATGFYYDSKGVETITYLSILAEAFARAGIPPKQAMCIIFACKYLSTRLGTKPDTPVEVDLLKAENYIHRARTGKWLPKEMLK